jgi:hypothetical protein
MSAAWALQQAVFASLAANEDIKDIVDDPPRIFDSVPRGVQFPYIVIGDDKESDFSTATEKSSEHQLTVHVWSRAPGLKQSRVAASAVIAALDGAALDVAGFALIDLRWLTTDTTRESDGETIHAQLKFRAVLEPQ